MGTLVSAVAGGGTLWASTLSDSSV